MLRIEAYQDAPSPPMSPELAAACAKAIHVIDPAGELTRGGRAALVLLGIIGWPRLAWLLHLPPFIWLVELAYFIVSRNRPFFARFTFRPKRSGPTSEEPR